MELMGVVPRVDTIENATPNDIINKPATNEQILLIILLILTRISYKKFFTSSSNRLHCL